MKRCTDCDRLLLPDEYGRYDGMCEWCSEAFDLDHGEGHTDGTDQTTKEAEGDLPDMCPYYC